MGGYKWVVSFGIKCGVQRETVETSTMPVAWGEGKGHVQIIQCGFVVNEIHDIDFLSYKEHRVYLGCSSCIYNSIVFQVKIINTWVVYNLTEHSISMQLN